MALLLKLLVRLIITTAALLVIAHLVPGIAIVSFYSALVVALLWGLISVTLRPVLHLLTLPINFLSLGLFSFILNALLFWMLASFVAGFSISGFIPALEGSVLLTLVSWALNAIL